jgi:iron complex transport system substrate-binding protein
MQSPRIFNVSASLLLLLLVVLSGCTAPIITNNAPPVPAVTPAPADAAAAPAETGDAFPATIENCGLAITYEAPPARAVTMNQAATEIMLALGLEDHMVGTAYMDDEILPEFQAAYESVPVLAAEYPSQEVLFAAEPDFVYGVYQSAFDDEAAGPREELLGLDINSYLSAVACEDTELRPDKASFETVYQEIRDIGRIFGVEDRAETLVADMQTQLAETLATIGEDVEPLRILWYDSEAEEPFVGACCGTPAMIIEAAGAQNIFDDVEGNWATVSWEEVVIRDPQAIVVIDAEWSTAQEKIDLLRNDPAYSSITAVQDERFVAIPFSATTVGVRNVSAVIELAKGLYPDKLE